MTILGSVQVSRSYYHCRHCHTGHFPRDAALRLTSGELSRGATEVVTLAGTLGSFAEAAQKILPRLSGLHVSESTVERTTEQAGEELGNRLSKGETFGPQKDWKWSKDAEEKTVAYVSADLTGIRMQGKNGSAAEGRMPAVAMVWNAGQEDRTRYVCGLAGGLAALADPLRNQGGQVGMDRAERWVAISDGGSGLEDWLRTNFPRVETVILDFFHAAEHLNDWAKVLHPDEAEASRVASRWCHRLKHEGGAVVLATLREIDVSGRSESVQELYREVLVYFENQVHRMDYPSYLLKGWLIGSGPVEAACKQVVGQRMKGSGMRWGEDGADAVCHLRALFRSEKSQWDAYWATPA